MSGLPTGQWTLKAEFAGDLRRLNPWPPVGREPSAAAVREAVARLFDFQAEEVESIVLKYQDDEGDLCTLTESSLTDALVLASEKPGRVLRLKVAQGFPRPLPPHASAAPAEGTAGNGGEEADSGGTAGQAWALFRRLSQVVQEEVRTTAAELKAAATEPDGLRNYSGVLRGRLTSHVEEARTAAAQVRTTAADAYSQASQGDTKAGLGLAAAVALPAAVVALAPGRCTRLGILAAGALAAAKLGDSLASRSPPETPVEQQQAQQPQAHQAPQAPQAEAPQPESQAGAAEADALEADTPSDGVVRQRAAPHFSGNPAMQLD